jgi:hypothetical protein
MPISEVCCSLVATVPRTQNAVPLVHTIQSVTMLTSAACLPVPHSYPRPAGPQHEDRECAECDRQGW